MKTRVLKFLKENRNKYISGQQISEQLGVTRAAVWKYIKSLKNDGYVIESSTKNGYMLTGCPDILTQEELSDQLRTDFTGRKIIHYGNTESTNKNARELAENGEPEGTAVTSETQYGGRGRMGRSWYSGSGRGIWMSVILRPGTGFSAVPLITLCACAAVVTAASEYTGRALVKWPNDVYLNGGKFCGVLTQLSGEPGMIDYAILGIGININQRREDFPENLRTRATSLYMETGKEISRRKFACNMLNEFEKCYLELKNKKSAARALSICRGHSLTIGRKISIYENKKEITAKAVGISDDGSLAVLPDGCEDVRMISREVKLL